ncbi:Hypothetical protein GSB_150690, partial [Giardia duodenalis]
VPLQAAFTILPVIKGFMAAKMGEENAGVKRMLDQRETSKSKQELGTGNEGEPVGQQETEADDIDADVDQ